MTAQATANRIVRETSRVSADELPDTSLLRLSRLSLYITLGALPLYTVRWHYGPLPTTLLETLILVTVALYAVARWRQGLRRPVMTGYEIAIAVFLAAGAVSILVASDHRGALGLYRAYFVEPVVLFYVAVDLLRLEVHLKRLVIAFAVGSSAFAILNLVVFYQALTAHAVSVGYAPSALYGDANYVAMYMEPPLAIATALLLIAQPPKWKALGAVWLALTGAALLASFSKGAYLAVAVLALVVIITLPRWRWATIGALVAAAVVATQIPLLMARLATVMISFNGRQEVFGATLDMLRQSPILGVGLGGYSYLFRGVTPEAHPHNLWLTFWVESGIVGAIAFGVILFTLLWRGWRAWPRTEDFERVVLWGALGGLVLWLVHGFVDTPYWKNDMSVEFWILAALQVVVLRRLSQPLMPAAGRSQRGAQS
jgi:O-antigen ligase